MKTEIRVDNGFVGVWRGGKNLYYAARNPHAPFRLALANAVDYVKYYYGIDPKDIDISPAYRWAMPNECLTPRGKPSS